MVKVVLTNIVESEGDEKEEGAERQAGDDG